MEVPESCDALFGALCQPGSCQVVTGSQLFTWRCLRKTVRQWVNTTKPWELQAHLGPSLLRLP